jgi:hypothetical protein
LQNMLLHLTDDVQAGYLCSRQPVWDEKVTAAETTEKRLELI